MNDLGYFRSVGSWYRYLRVPLTIFLHVLANKRERYEKNVTKEKNEKYENKRKKRKNQILYVSLRKLGRRHLAQRA